MVISLYLYRKHHEEKFMQSAALCEWIATLLILAYVLTLLPQLDGIEISLLKVTSGHSHSGFCGYGSSKSKKDEEMVVT